MSKRRNSLKTHAAYLLAAKLRARGVYATGREILEWPVRTVRAAQQWLDMVHVIPDASSWKEFMGVDLPPPNHQSWLTFSASFQDLGDAGPIRPGSKT